MTEQERADNAAAYTAQYVKRLEMAFGPKRALEVLAAIGRDTEKKPDPRPNPVAVIAVGRRFR